MTRAAVVLWKRERRPPPRPREFVEELLEPGEPIEAYVRSARTSPPPGRTGFGLAGPRSAALAAGMAPSVAIVLTDRRMFLVRGSNRSGMRVVRRAAVKVLHYDTTGPSIVLWLNIDSQPIGFDIPTGLRTSTDALARALGTPPPSFTHPEDR